MSTSHASSTPTIALAGHEQPLRTLTNVLRDSWRRQQLPPEQAALLRPRHLLVSGTAGSGKTALIRHALEASDQPYHRLSAAGWLRDCRDLPSAESLLQHARRDGDTSTPSADTVLWIDDIHALVVPEEDERASAARAVQRELVRLLDNDSVCASHLLLILSGSGSGGKAPDLYPDLAARIVTQVALEPLGDADLITLLQSDHLPFCARYSALAAAEGITLAFDADAVAEIAAIANDLNARHDDIGAHRLPALLDRVVADLLNPDAHDAAAEPDITVDTPDAAGTSTDADTDTAPGMTTVTVTAALVEEALADLLEEDDLEGAIL